MPLKYFSNKIILRFFDCVKFHLGLHPHFSRLQCNGNIFPKNIIWDLQLIEISFGDYTSSFQDFECTLEIKFEVFSCLKFCLGLHPFFQDLKCALKINFEVFSCLKSHLRLDLFFSRPQMCFRKKIPSNICKVVSERKEERKTKERKQQRKKEWTCSFFCYVLL